MNSAAEPYVCVIGAANVDLAGRSRGAIINRESNPGSLHVSWGGVGRNIAENLARLEVPVHMITVLGDDEYGNRLAQQASAVGIRLSARIIESEVTPSYLSINDQHGELVLAISAMDLLEHLTADLILENQEIIRQAELCVIDANLNQHTISFLLEHFPEMNFCADLVSMPKADKLAPWLGRFSIIKPNRAEAERLSGFPISGRKSLQAAADFFIEKGVNQVFISLGRDGLFYADGRSCGVLKADPGSRIISTTGAGDAMMAALVCAGFHHLELAEAARNAMAASLLALQHQDAVNPHMSMIALQKMKEKIRHD